jgi:DNA-binding transcriptional regulator YdaS (Cro superfamily)
MRAMNEDMTPAERRERAAERRRLAVLAKVDEAYLYQCLTGRRDMNPAEARRCETVTAGALRRWSLCQKTWYLIWPELIGIEGAPVVPTAQVEQLSDTA